MSKDKVVEDTKNSSDDDGVSNRSRRSERVIAGGNTEEGMLAAGKPPICAKVITLSDRAMQRMIGSNAFLRGRLYARRGAVDGLKASGHVVFGRIPIRSADAPYETAVTLQPDGSMKSKCSCPGWRGEDKHCKHVAAILVALRDRERPPKKQNQQKKNQPESKTVSAGGKKRRSRRRKKGKSTEKIGAGEVEVVSAKDLAGKSQSRGAVDAWIPTDALPKSYDFDFRMAVRAASILITPVLRGSRTAFPISEAIQGFNTVSAGDRSLFRLLSRHAGRSKSTSAELRGEDAAEALSLLRGRRVFLEPSSMEVRFSDEPLRPKIELDRLDSKTLRTRVVFAVEGSSRRFALNGGAWFEGSPSWHLDTTDGIARPLADSVTPGWLTRLYRSPSIVHPMRDLQPMLNDYIPRIAVSLNAELPDLSQVADLVDAQPRFLLRCDGELISASTSLQVSYEDQDFDVPVNGFPMPLAFLPPNRRGGRPRVVRRDVGAEMMAVQALLDLSFEVDEEEEGKLFAEGDAAISFWTQGITSLPSEWEKLIPDNLVDVKIRKTNVAAQMRVSSGVDWLALDMSFKADGVAVSADELRACLESGRKLVRLEDGSFAPVDADEVGDVLTRMAEIYAGQSADGEKLPLSQAGRVQDLLKVMPNAKVAASAKKLFSKLEDIDEVPSVTKPRSIKATLRPYQKKGFSWLAFIHGLGSGGILADDMGLGKTLQTITLLVWAKSKARKRKLSVVVAPTSVVGNWQREIKKFAPTFNTVVWQGAKRHELRDELDKADVMITSYALLRRDEEMLSSLDLRYVILDEAQHIKNPMSATARAAKRLPSDRRLALTGTPIENRLSEMWSIFDFVSPGLLGKLKDFEERVSRPIDRGDREVAKRLRETIRPFVLRRLKSDVAKDLPPKIEQEIVVPMEDAQRNLYKQILEEVRKDVLSEVEKKGVAKSQIQILAALTRLRQVACDPRLVNFEDGGFSQEDSGKLSALREIVANAISGGHRILIFSQFVTMLTFIRKAFEAEGIAYEYIDGSSKDRMDKVDRFNEDESIPVFLISLKAGGTGLNLTGADTVIHFDPWWNPAVEDQATDRAHRIGQTKVVNVYRLVSEGSVEEKILELSAKKRALMESVLSTEGTPLKGLTKKDVDSLFSD